MADRRDKAEEGGDDQCGGTDGPSGGGCRLVSGPAWPRRPTGRTSPWRHRPRAEVDLESRTTLRGWLRRRHGRTVHGTARDGGGARERSPDAVAVHLLVEQRRRFFRGPDAYRVEERLVSPFGQQLDVLILRVSRRVDGHRHPVRVAMQFRELARLLREGVFVSGEDADAQGSLDATGE